MTVALSYIHIFTKFGGKFWYDHIFHKSVLEVLHGFMWKAEAVEKVYLIFNNEGYKPRKK